MGFNSSAVIASVLGSLLVVGIVLVVTNSNDVNAPAEAQQTELMWGDNSAPLGLVDGWNTSVGTAAEREAAARHFHVTIADDDSLWKHNVFTPFAGKTLKMVGIDILKRNAFNTLIEYKVKQGNVAWTVEPGPHGVWGPMVEHIDGKYTGTSRNAGYASPSEWIENDYKVFLGHKIENDWGLVNATSWDKTTVVIDYQSYQKGHFIMTWQLPQESEVEPTTALAAAEASATYQKEDKALRALYAATGGPHNWRTECDGCAQYPYTKGNKWGGTNNHCEWFGVECVDPYPPFTLNSVVERLMLGQTNLSGTLPESIGDFESLTQLDVSGGWPEHPENKISGTVPASIGALKKVNNLRLNNQAFSGAIPASIGDMAFSGMANGLTLENNEFTGPLPASLCELFGTSAFDGLNYFDVSNNHLTGTVPKACFIDGPSSGPQSSGPAFMMMLENDFTGPVPACRGQSCPGPCGLHAPVSCTDCRQVGDGGGCCEAGKTCP